MLVPSNLIREKNNWEVALGTFGWSSSSASPGRGNRNLQEVPPVSLQCHQCALNKRTLTSSIHCQGVCLLEKWSITTCSNVRLGFIEWGWEKEKSSSQKKPERTCWFLPFCVTADHHRLPNKSSLSPLFPAKTTAKGRDGTPGHTHIPRRGCSLLVMHNLRMLRASSQGSPQKRFF